MQEECHLRPLGNGGEGICLWSTRNSLLLIIIVLCSPYISLSWFINNYWFCFSMFSTMQVYVAVDIELNYKFFGIEITVEVVQGLYETVQDY